MSDPIRQFESSESRLRSQAELMDLVDDAILVWELEGAIEYWNAGAERLYGFPVSEAIGRVSHELLQTRFPDGPEAARETLRHTGHWQGELVHRTRAGQPLIVSARMTLAVRNDRRVVLEVNRDITQRKLSELELERARLLLAEGQRIARLGVWEYVAATQTTSWSEELKRIFGLENSEPSPTYGEMLRRFIHPEDSAELDRKFQAALQAGAIFENENRILRKDGSVRHIYNRGRPYLEGNGTLVRYVGITQDITERKQAEVDLRQSEVRQALALDAAQAGTWEWDLATGRNVWSEQLWNLYGLVPNSCEPSYEVWLRTVHPEDRRQVDTQVKEVARQNLEMNMEWRVRGPEGSTRWLMSRGRPEFDASGQAIRYLGVVVDISARKQAEDEIRRLNASLEQRVRERTAQLEAANQELEAFSYSVSHDLRAPLRAVSGYVGFLQEDYASRLDAEGHRLLDIIRNEAQRMGQLIDDLLAFSRLGRQDLKRSRVDMAALARSVFEGLRTEGGATSARLELKSMPSVRGDPAMIRQALTNLLENAVKFSARQESPLVEVGADAMDSETVFHVRDNGVGFDERYRHKLFGVFQRLHSQEEFPGTGVGLALVQRVIHRHGGRIWAESQPGHGATFYFTLPTFTPDPSNHADA